MKQYQIRCFHFLYNWTIRSLFPLSLFYQRKVMECDWIRLISLSKLWMNISFGIMRKLCMTIGLSINCCLYDTSRKVWPVYSEFGIYRMFHLNWTNRWKRKNDTGRIIIFLRKIYRFQRISDNITFKKDSNECVP